MALNAGVNLRNVWTIPTQPRPEAHFATFPDALTRLAFWPEPVPTGFVEIAERRGDG